MTTTKLFKNWKSIKKSVSVNGKSVELISVDHVVFNDVYYIEVDGITEYMQYGTRKLEAIFNEFITENFDIVYGY
jgi:hypothetical protein